MGRFCRRDADAATDPAGPAAYMRFIFFRAPTALDFQRRSPPPSAYLGRRIVAHERIAMSTREHSHLDRAWQRDPYTRRASDTPSDCDCGDTIRELLLEIAGTAAVFVAIILIVQALG